MATEVVDNNLKHLKWTKFAAVRTKPDYLVPKYEGNTPLFPIERQPILSHAIVKALAFEKRNFILVQSLYRYLREISDIETSFIYETAIRIAMSPNFPKEVSRAAFTVAIDEVYHAYCAVDLIDQLQQQLNIVPLEFPTTQFETAILEIKRMLSPALHKDFEIVAVSISESLIGSEAGELSKEENLHKTVRDFTYDHMIDEVRHARIFVEVLKAHWSGLAPKSQTIFKELLPKFISGIFRPESQMIFDKKILKAVDLNETDIQKVISDTYSEDNSVESERGRKFINNIFKFLDKCNIYL